MWIDLATSDLKQAFENSLPRYFQPNLTNAPDRVR